MKIATYQEYIDSKRVLADCDMHIVHTRIQLEKQDLTPEQVQRCLDPVESFRQGVWADITVYEESTRPWEHPA